MGKQIEQLIDPNEFNLLGKYDIEGKIQDNFKEIPNVAIEFSTPAAVIENIKFLASKKINIVCGTTGWYDKSNEVKEIVNSAGIGFIYASNFSVGVNIFFQVVKYASGLINKFEQYDSMVEETHHTQE